MKALLSVMVVLVLAMVVAGSAYAQTPMPAPNFTYSGPPPPGTYMLGIVSGQMSVTAWDGTLTGKIQQQCHIEPDWIGGIAATGFICDATFSADFSATWDSVNLKFVGTASYQFEAKGGGTLTPSYTPLVSIIQIERSGSGQLKAEFTPAALEEWPSIFAIGGKPPVGVIFYDQNESDRLTTNGTRIDVSQDPPTTITCDTASCNGPALDWIIQVSPLTSPELTIQGPSRVYPGVPAKFTAYRDGAPVNAIWTCSSDRGVIDANGVFTAPLSKPKYPDVTIAAAYSNLSASVTVDIGVPGDDWFQGEGHVTWGETELGFAREYDFCKKLDYNWAGCKMIVWTWLANLYGWGFQDPTFLGEDLAKSGPKRYGGCGDDVPVGNTAFTGASLNPFALGEYLSNRILVGHFYGSPPPAGASGLIRIGRPKYNTGEWQWVIQNLKEGIPVPIEVTWYHPDDVRPWHPHWVLGLGLNADGKIIIRDPNNFDAPYQVLDEAHNRTHPTSTYVPVSAEVYLPYDRLLTTDVDATSIASTTRGVTAQVFSPVHVMVTDPLGRRFGVDTSSGLLVDEIPSASYILDSGGSADDSDPEDIGLGVDYDPISDPDAPGNLGEKVLTVAAPLPGPYKVQVYGLADGQFDLFISWRDSNGGEVLYPFQGSASAGSVEEFEFTLSGVQYFYDVGINHWAYDQITAIYGKGICMGYSDGTYQPSTPVTRDQMAVYIARALAGGDSNVPDFTGTPTFPDVPDTFWALKYVEFAVDQGVVAGYDDGNYHPEYEVTRDQMAVYVARSLVAPAGEAGLTDYVPSDPRNFPDVPSDFWAWKHVEYCVEHGVVNGYEDGLYHPEIVVTRDQMAVYIARAFGLL